MYCTECITPLRLQGTTFIRLLGRVKQKSLAVCPMCLTKYVVMRERPVRVWPIIVTVKEGKNA